MAGQTRQGPRAEDPGGHDEGAERTAPRQRLLDAVVTHFTEEGLADQSLRRIAEAVETSHRMLLYHFGSREGLLVAVARAVEEAQQANLPRWGITTAEARRLWQHFSDPRLWPQERLFFELYAHALLGRPGTEGFLEAVVEPWITALADVLVKEGVDSGTARAEARLAMAVTRGLLLDLLATGDRAGVTEAYERYLQRGQALMPYLQNGDAQDSPAGRSAQPHPDR
jgi:AcrR family transcriptional regulator